MFIDKFTDTCMTLERILEFPILVIDEPSIKEYSTDHVSWVFTYVVETEIIQEEDKIRMILLGDTVTLIMYIALDSPRIVGHDTIYEPPRSIKLPPLIG